ncbi:MAG: hypothetical protein ABIZ81_09155 [Opitutaceae bacterium]
MNAVPESSTSDAPHPLQIKAWREMGGSGRSELAAELRRKVRSWKRDALRAQHPDWPEARVERELARIYLRATT